MPRHSDLRLDTGRHERRSFRSGVGGPQGGQSQSEVAETVTGEEGEDNSTGCASRASVDRPDQLFSCNNNDARMSRLMRAAKKLRLAVPAVQLSRVAIADREAMAMDDRNRLDEARETRRRLEVEKGRTAVLHALESVQQRHGEQGSYGM